MLFCKMVDLSILRVLAGSKVPSSLIRTLNWSLLLFSDLFRETLNHNKTINTFHQKLQVWNLILRRSKKGSSPTAWPYPSHPLPSTRQKCCHHPCDTDNSFKYSVCAFNRHQVVTKKILRLFCLHIKYMHAV